MAATLYPLAEADGDTGARDLRIWRFILAEPGAQAALGADYERIRDLLDEADASPQTNKRGWVKRILLGDPVQYPPWETLKLPENTWHGLRPLVAAFDWRLELSHGKVYAVPWAGDTRAPLNQMIFDLLVGDLPSGLQANFETSHVTLVNSDVVAQVDPDELVAFLATEVHKVEAAAVLHTVSNDWARFSTCYVMSLVAPTLLDFLQRFNEHFGLATRVTVPHLTFAVAPRDLALRMPM